MDKIRLPAGNLSIKAAFNADTFGVDLIINNKITLELQLEQWEKFAKEIMKSWMDNSIKLGD